MTDRSNRKVDSLKIIVIDDLDSAAVWSDKLECFPLVFRELSTLFVEHMVCSFHTISKWVHQNVNFKSFSNVSIERLFVKSSIDLIYTQVLNYNFFFTK